MLTVKHGVSPSFFQDYFTNPIFVVLNLSKCHMFMVNPCKTPHLHPFSLLKSRFFSMAKISCFSALALWQSETKKPLMSKAKPAPSSAPSPQANGAPKGVKMDRKDPWLFNNG